MTIENSLRLSRNRLARMRRVKTESLKELYKSGELVRAYAQKKIREGAVSGPAHVASAPGDFPNADTHELDAGIDVRLNPSRLSVSVVSTAPYSAFLEFGTAKMAPRPFMVPSLKANRNRVVLGQVQAAQRTIRTFKGNPGRSLANYRDFTVDSDE